MGNVTHKPKTGTLLTGTEYEASDAHTISLTASDVGAAATAHVHSGADITSGTVADGNIAATIARDSEVTTAVTTHEAAGDPHTGYRLESADHSHATTGLQGGTVAHSVLTGISATDHHAAPAAGPDANITIDGTGAAGTASTFARSGHGHQLGTSSAVAIAIGTAAAGTSTTAPSRGDHVHPTGAGTPSTQAFGDAAATGTGPAAAMTDHKHAMPADPVTAHVAAGDPHPVYLTQTEGDAAYQPLDSDLTAIAALATTSYGRSLLAAADAAALRTIEGTLASADQRIPVEDPTFELAGSARTTLGGSSELFFATNDRQFKMSAAYAQSITVPNGYWRLHYRELQLTAANRLNCVGTSDFVLTDMGAQAGRLTLAGRS